VSFTPTNLPYGSFRPSAAEPPRLGVALGDGVVDVGALALDGVPRDLVAAPNLDPLLAAGPAAWAAVRAALLDAVAAGVPDDAVTPLADATLELPFTVGDYVDFYSSLEHATNLGRLFRPDGEALLPNWRHVPIGYHGRSRTVVPSGTPVRRPWGQLPGDAGPVFAPTRRLDIELELGFVTGGPRNRLGEPIPIDEAAERIFGFVLVNDWSARDIQRWEYQPLGPFLGKSFATSIAPWVVPVAALEPFRVPPPRQEPAPLPYLRAADPWNLDIALTVEVNGTVVSRGTTAGLYWTASQQLAHATSNGAIAGPGDLFASGTISGAERGSEGSLIELTRNGAEPVHTEDGERTFLEDGDTVTLSAVAGEGDACVSLGSVTGTIVPALPPR
jgi:fumarylacetoacetase